MNHSHTSLSTFRRCKYKFYLQHKLGLTLPQGLGQKRGSAGHAAMEHYYRDDSRDAEAAIQHAWNKYSEDQSQINQDDWNLLEGCLNRYFTYAKRNDRFTTKEVEWRFNIDIAGRNFVGFIDAVVEYQGRIWLMEHKFNKKVQTTHLDYDPQVSTYMLAAYLHDMNPAGVIYNIIRVADGKTALAEPVVRKFIYRNPEGLNYFIEEIEKQIKDVEDLLEGDEVPYRSLTADCSWDCNFLKVCMTLNEEGNADYIIDTYERKPNE